MFDTISTHACALIQCDCGEYISISDDRAETCSNCKHNYQIDVKVVEIELPEEKSAT